MNEELIIKTHCTDEMFVYAEIKNPSIIHRLGFATKFLNLVEDEDYIVMRTKPKCIVIIFNPNENYEYKIANKIS
jgi:hypothetical protein